MNNRKETNMRKEILRIVPKGFAWQVIVITILAVLVFAMCAKDADGKGPLNPVVTNYAQAMAYIKANPGSWVQRTDWAPQQWIFQEPVTTIIKCRLPSSEIVVYQTISGYNLSEDNQVTWQVVG